MPGEGVAGGALHARADGITEDNALNHYDKTGATHAPRILARPTMVAAAVLLLAGLSACGNKESKPGQALASVNGEEVTVLQLNEELQRAGVPAAQQDAASKQILESLIDRQLLLNEAAKEKLDRDPKVMQSIERAKAMIVAQAYIQKKIGAPTRPSADEVAEYFDKHPQFFSNRKQLDMRELVVASKDMESSVKATIDSAKSLDEVAAWMEQHKVNFVRTQLSRTTADLAPELSGKLLSLPKGQLFIIKEGERSMVITIADVKDAPVTLEQAKGQIEQFLFNKKNKEAADAELARLRTGAKIVYLNGRSAPEKAAAAPAASAPAAAEASSSGDAAARGVAGLK